MDRNRRSRSRSRDRERNDRGGDRGRGDFARDRGGDNKDRDSHQTDGRNRSERDRYDRERIERDERESKSVVVASSEAAVSKPLSREEQEAKRKERLALVKRITQGTDSDDEGGGTANNPGAKGPAEGEEEEDEEAEMARLMGFGDFSTTKGKPVDDNILGAGAGAVSKHKARKYRQYMNRKSGFNRPLAKMD